jgi:hypothetical protein
MKRRNFTILMFTVHLMARYTTALSSADSRKNRASIVIVDTLWTSKQDFSRPTRRREKSQCSSRLSNNNSNKARQSSPPCPDPESDWMQDRMEAIFAVIGTIWAYCTSTITITVVNSISSFLSLKIQALFDYKNSFQVRRDFHEYDIFYNSNIW